jgi:hypothetical protein
MAFEISESLVSLAYQSLGYFVIEGRKVGMKEIDLLAVRVGKDGEIEERLQIEISISVSPIGVLRRQAKLGRSAEEPARSVEEWREKKFGDRRVVREVTETFRGKPYDHVFVHGQLKDPSQLAVLGQAGIKCVEIGDLIRKAVTEGKPNRLHRAVGIASLIARQGLGGSLEGAADSGNSEVS